MFGENNFRSFQKVENDPVFLEIPAVTQEFLRHHSVRTSIYRGI